MNTVNLFYFIEIKMKYLVAGLGNVGFEYSNTRHNIGFDILDHCAQKMGFEFQTDRYASVGVATYKGRGITFIKPTTYMNLSGNALSYWMNKLNVEAKRTLVVVDDLSLDLGKLRMRSKGSHAGHNGLKDIELNLQSSKYPRLKVGIGNDFPRGRQVEFVLGQWSEEERIVMDGKMDQAYEMILSFVFRGITQTMSDFNE